MLRAWLGSGARSSVAELGPAFLPARCQGGTHGPLVELLRAAGVHSVGACWKAGEAIEAMIFAPPDAPRARLILSDGSARYEYEAPAGGVRFRLPCPRQDAVWSLAFFAAGAAAPELLRGSPLVFAPTQAAPAAPEAIRPVSIVIPVYRDMRLVQACINSVLATLPGNLTRAEIVVIDDASPEPALSAWLDQLAAAGRITLLRNQFNLGFIETVNRGMRHHRGHDVLLLNADTLVHGDWIDRLKTALHSAPDIASVTPWSNNGEISSFPTIATATPAPTAAQLAQIDTIAAQLRAAGATADVALPSCCGFTMLIRRDVLDQIGMLDGVALVRGYGEEVDWCLRASAAGYRHLNATGVFVAHAGTVSFRFEKTLRVRQNRQVLAARYPHYHPEYHAFISDDPLTAARSALREALVQAGSAWLETSLRLLGGDADLARTLPAPIAGSCTRIAVWQHRIEAPGNAKVLQLARLLASRGADVPPLRLLVIGDASEALWRTGVVDVVPATVWQESSLFSDATLLGLAGCSVLLSERDSSVAPGIEHVTLDDGFEPQAWLATRWAPKRRPAPTPQKKTASA
ncbi:glycosyltransferase family 2 protein [Massilia sp. GCM10020059]|uniref:Glycosyltransferase n=1 Tax=Massilia agrisoli TaxID=2892444 RepID=A0ABS8IRS2_9BURK|nr:glycosyltransferase [Massilia agrisoli]MCC6071289.1 glycosyltransferase [Massilia agrisoli]